MRHQLLWWSRELCGWIFPFSFAYFDDVDSVIDGWIDEENEKFFIWRNKVERDGMWNKGKFCITFTNFSMQSFLGSKFF